MSAAGGGAFGRGGAGVLAAVALASLATSAFLGVYGDVLSEPQTAAADAWSPSALGHRAYLDLLRGLGRPVIVSRHATEEKAADGAVVALLEPELEEDDDGPRRAQLGAIDEASTRLLVALPKRRGAPHALRRRWVGPTVHRPPADAARVLDALGIDAEVVRPAGPLTGWRGELPAPTLAEPQLLRSEALHPLLACDQGILVGAIEGDGYTTLVLADPDVLATHGLGAGLNAAVAVGLVDRLGPPGEPLVVDETLHGHALRPSLARELLRFPLALATAHAALVAALLAWIALVRFGRPTPPAPALAMGKGPLVDHTAELLRHGGHVSDAAAAYLRAARDEVVARLRPPGDTEDPRAWLARHAAARGKARALRLLEERVARLDDDRRGAAQEALRAAAAIHRWREEMTDGAPADP